jgi:hypothetical protein
MGVNPPRREGSSQKDTNDEGISGPSPADAAAISCTVDSFSSFGPLSFGVACAGAAVWAGLDAAPGAGTAGLGPDAPLRLKNLDSFVCPNAVPLDGEGVFGSGVGTPAAAAGLERDCFLELHTTEFVFAR